MKLGLLLAKLLLLSAFVHAQVAWPLASAPTTELTQIGLTEFSLTYNRPSVKGRVIFGELIPYGELWRTGANAATKLRFNRPIRLGEQTVAAGTYALYTIPDTTTWTLVLNADTTLWGARGYDPEKNVARIEAPAERLAEREATMVLRWRNIRDTAADLTLEWEYTRVNFPVSLFTHQQVAENLADQLGPRATGADYYRAARYYLDNGLDLEQALRWLERRAELDGEHHGAMRLRALAKYRLGDTTGAIQTLERSLALAREANDPYYLRMNEATLAAWQKVPISLAARDILARSIAYHDPTGAWANGRFAFQLYEGRPGGAYRISEVTIDQGAGTFSLRQRRERDLIYRYLGPDTCALALNGRRDFPEEAARQYRLTCDQSPVYANYYTYLWGLPMKLRDEGTVIHPRVFRTLFFGEELLEVKVTYEPEVGADTWYFYFHPGTYALRGYRFYHDEAANDGEYILLEGEAPVGPLRLPAKRHWYTHGDRLYLGSDELLPYGAE